MQQSVNGNEIHNQNGSLKLPTVDNIPSLSSRIRSFGCLSDTTTDIDEFFDAFDDEEDMIENISDQTITNPLDTFDTQSSNIGNLEKPASNMMPDDFSQTKTTTFHTARDKNTASDVTINDSISNFSSEDEDKTLGSIEFNFCR